MNSSGIKRGLAAGAISALAVTGLPFLASSADAAAGDTLVVTATGPALNGGTEGGVVVLKTKTGTVDPAQLALTSTNGSTVDSQDNADQNAQIVDYSIDTNPKSDGYDVITLHIVTTTATTGDAATFRVFDNDGSDAKSLEASEARANVSISTAGALSKIDVSPASQSTAQGLTSGAYTVTLQDAAGRTTQLMKGESVAITTDDATVSTDESGQAITSDEIDAGTDTFKGTTTNATPTGSHDITLTGPGAKPVVGKATLVVTPAANLTANNVDIVTGADSWDGFGGGAFGGASTAVRVDQSSIRIDIKGGAGNANSTVALTLNGAGGSTDVTFGGKTTSTVSTVLDKDGNGSLTITPDAGTIQEGDTIDIGGSFTETLQFERSNVAQGSIESADRYFSAIKGSVDVTAKVVDQFGMPVSSGYVTAKRTGPANTDTTAQKKAVGSDGTVTFTFTDAKATNGQTDTVDFEYYPDQYATSSKNSGSTEIKYTTDGMGSDFATWLGGDNTEAKDYKASDVSVVPLADAKDNATGDSAVLEVRNGEAGSDMTISVDNGALILPVGKFDLSDGKSSITETVPAGQTVSGYKIVGTKAGVVTVTVSSANRTETAEMTVADETDQSTARNVSVSGPAEVEHGVTQIAYTALVTDAFGNPVANVPVTDLNVQVTGPAMFQDSDAMTNAAGQLNLNVRVDSDAAGDVKIQVQGLGEQFGAAEDQKTTSDKVGDAKGLPASSNVGNATTTVDAATPPPVEGPKYLNMKLQAWNNGAKDDVLHVNANKHGAGLTATIYRHTKNGLKKVTSVVLNAKGNNKVTVADKNGRSFTKYVARVAATDTTHKAHAKRRVR